MQTTIGTSKCECTMLENVNNEELQNERKNEGLKEERKVVFENSQKKRFMSRRDEKRQKAGRFEELA